MSDDLRVTPQQVIDILAWIYQNPGVDSRDVSERFNISGMEASDLTQAFLRAGLLDFAD